MVALELLSVACKGNINGAPAGKEIAPFVTPVMVGNVTLSANRCSKDSIWGRRVLPRREVDCRRRERCFFMANSVDKGPKTADREAGGMHEFILTDRPEIRQKMRRNGGFQPPAGPNMPEIHAVRAAQERREMLARKPPPVGAEPVNNARETASGGLRDLAGPEGSATFQHATRHPPPHTRERGVYFVCSR
jgi:hypothetical protein